MNVPGSAEDAPFRHYSTKHRIVAWISRNLLDNITYTVHHGLLKGMKRRGGLAWLPEFMTGSTRTPESDFWMNLDLKGLVIYDIGAFHGLLTLYFARQGKQVISYEPNTRNHARLTENLRLNGLKNVLVRKTGVGAKVEVATMVSSPATPGGAAIQRDGAAPLQSRSGMISEEIPITTLDHDIEEMSLPAPEFVKIDVEGEELSVLMGAQKTLRTHHPVMFLEMHGGTMNIKRKNVAAIVACLNELGYSDIEHIESGSKINAENSALAAEGHLYCR